MENKQYDLIVIGSGPAGLAALGAAAEAGAGKMAVIEAEDRLGGECPNWGCMPTKSLMQTVDILEHCGRGAEFGVPGCGGRADFRAAQERQRRVVEYLTGGRRLSGLIRRFGADLLKGRAEFVSPREIAVGRRRYRARRFVVAAGAPPFVPAISGLPSVPRLGVREALVLKEAPESLLIVGGGPVGVEFARIFSAFGTRCIIAERAGQILPNEEREAAAVVAESLRRRGVGMFVSSSVAELHPDGAGAEALIRPAGGGAARKVLTSAVFLAVGKRSPWPELGAERAGVRLDGRGWPILSGFLQTSNRSIYAAGDCAGRMMYTAVAHLEGEAAARNALKGNRQRVDLRVVPRGTYGDPEVGSVGLTESQAKAAGFRVAVGLAPFGALSKPVVTGEPLGLVKIVCDRRTKEIIGGHVVGHAASEIVHALAVAMQGRMKCTDLAGLPFAFPTYSEAIRLAALNVR